MAEDIRSRRRRRPRPTADDGAESDKRTTDEEFPAAQGPHDEAQDTLDSGPIHRELSRRGLHAEDGAEGEQEPDLSEVEADALVFDGPAEGDAGATFVGELPPAASSPDKTAILAASDIEAPEPVPVLTIENQDGQSDVEVVKDRFVIGRSPDCDVVLPDQLVSRQHAAIEKRDDEWALIDLQSGNGTFLNDKRISEEPLYDGDEIHIGDSRIIFTAPGGRGGQVERGPDLHATAMLPAAREGTNVTGLSTPPAKRRKKKLLLIAIPLVAVIGLLGIAKKMTTPTGPTPEQIAAQKAAEEAQALEEARQQAWSSFEKGKALLQENKWSEALPLILAAAEVLPDEKTVLDYKKTVEQEAAAEKLVMTARTQLTDRDFEGAKASLASITHETVFEEEIKSLKVQADEGMRDSKLELALAAMADKRCEDARAAADDILKSFPDHEAAAELKRKAEACLAKPEPPRCKHPPCGKKPPPPPPPPPKNKYLLVGQALDLYHANKVDEALAQASSSGVSQDGIKALREFQQHSKSGLGMANDTGQAEQSIKFLLKALELDKRLGGSKGAVTEKLRSTLGKVYFVRGVDAQTSSKFPLAYDSFTKALVYKPDLKQADERLRKLEAEAKKLFETAYVIKTTSPEKAIAHCQTVTQMVNKSNQYYSKCKKMIAQIQGGGDDSAEEF